MQSFLPTNRGEATSHTTPKEGLPIQGYAKLHLIKTMFSYHIVKYQAQIFGNTSNMCNKNIDIKICKQIR